MRTRDHCSNSAMSRLELRLLRWAGTPGARPCIIRFQQSRRRQHKRDEAHPSRRHEATNTASASASFSINHSPGNNGLSPLPFFLPSWINPLTPCPSTRITVSCALDEIAFAILILSISSESLMIRALPSAGRRKASVEQIQPCVLRSLLSHLIYASGCKYLKAVDNRRTFPNTRPDVLQHGSEIIRHTEDASEFVAMVNEYTLTMSYSIFWMRGRPAYLLL